MPAHRPGIHWAAECEGRWIPGSLVSLAPRNDEEKRNTPWNDRGGSLFVLFVHRNIAPFTTLPRGNGLSAAFSLKGAGERLRKVWEAGQSAPPERESWEEACVRWFGRRPELPHQRWPRWHSQDRRPHNRRSSSNSATSWHPIRPRARPPKNSRSWPRSTPMAR